MRPNNVALFGHHKDQRKTFSLCRSTATLLSSEHQYICAIGESICALRSPYTKYPSPCVWPCLRPAFDAIWGISAAAATCNFCDPTNRFCIGARPGESSDHHFSSFDSFGLARLAASATWIPPLPRVSISWAMHISGGAPLRGSLPTGSWLDLRLYLGVNDRLRGLRSSKLCSCWLGLSAQLREMKRHRSWVVHHWVATPRCLPHVFSGSGSLARRLWFSSKLCLLLLITLSTPREMAMQRFDV